MADNENNLPKAAVQIIADSAESSLQPRHDALLERFLQEQDVKPSSRYTYRRMLRAFLRWAQQEGLAWQACGREELLRYKTHLLARGLSELTVSGYLTVVRRLYNWAETSGLAPDAARSIKSPRRRPGFRKDPLQVEQIRALLAGIDRESLQGIRDFALVNLLLRTGLRTIEICRSNIADIGFRGSERVLFVQGKGRDAKDAFVVLTPASWAPLERWLQERKTDPVGAPLFISLSNRNHGSRLSTRMISWLVKHYLRKAGYDSRRLSAHSLRHTAGVQVLKAGGDLYTTQLFMRHSNPATTELYLRSIEEEIRLKNAPEKLLDDRF